MSKGALGLLSAYWPEGTARYGHIPLERATLGCLHKTAEQNPERTALRDGDRTLSYAALSARVATLAAALRERGDTGDRVAVLLDDAEALLATAFAAVDADRLVYLASEPPPAAALAAFAPRLVVADAARELALPAGAERVAPDALSGGDPDATAPRPKLREPVLALPAADGAGEVLHNHKTLLATGIAFGSFFMLEPGAELALLELPTSWLPLAALLGAWRSGATVHVAWRGAASLPEQRVDYAVGSLEVFERAFLEPGSRPWPGHLGAGAIVGTSGALRTSLRRRLARRLGAPVLTAWGRNDLGPVLASHPTWFLDDAVGIPLPNVDTRPFDPVAGQELSIGWDSVEEAELGVKSALAPAGGELVGSWLRSHEIAHVDPTGVYFLRGRYRR